MLNNIVITTLTYTERNFKFKFVLRGLCVFEEWPKPRRMGAQASFIVKFLSRRRKNSRSYVSDLYRVRIVVRDAFLQQIRGYVKLIFEGALRLYSSI
jgi:hypothetical protein